MYTMEVFVGSLILAGAHGLMMDHWIPLVGLRSHPNLTKTYASSGKSKFAIIISLEPHFFAISTIRKFLFFGFPKFIKRAETLCVKWFREELRIT